MLNFKSYVWPNSGLPLCTNVKQVKNKMNLKLFITTELASRAGFSEM